MKLCLLIPIYLISFATLASDDANHNAIAKTLKKSIVKKVSKANGLEGFCDVYIYMRHQGKSAFVTRVKTNGDRKICKLSRHNVKIGRKFTYDNPEKIIRLHITP